MSVINSGSSFLLCLFTSSLSFRLFEMDPRFLRSSPLDDSGIEVIKSSNRSAITRLSKKLQSNSSVVNDMVYNTSQLVASRGRNLPRCLRGCTKQLFETFDTAVRSSNNYERFKNVCSRYIKTLDCIKKLRHCSDFELFHMLTSGLQYMCVEQNAAFNASIACIDHYVAEIKDACAKSCNGEGVVAGWAAYSALRGTSLFSPPVGNTPSKVNVVFFRKMTSEGCTVIECYLTCLRTKYNQHCENSYAGSLLLEVLLRPVAKGHNSMFLGPLLNLVRLIMPDECNFIMSTNGLSHYRVDERLSTSLKKLFEGSGTGTRTDLLSHLTGKKVVREHEEILDPWQETQLIDSKDSPLEVERHISRSKGIADLQKSERSSVAMPLGNRENQPSLRLEGPRKYAELEARYARGEVGYVPLPF